MANLILRWGLELPISDKLDAKHETCSPDVADDCKGKNSSQSTV
jgi:hypothetical protein